MNMSMMLVRINHRLGERNDGDDDGDDGDDGDG